MQLPAVTISYRSHPRPLAVSHHIITAPQILRINYCQG